MKKNEENNFRPLLSVEQFKYILIQNGVSQAALSRTMEREDGFVNHTLARLPDTQFVFVYFVDELIKITGETNFYTAIRHWNKTHDKEDRISLTPDDED